MTPAPECSGSQVRPRTGGVAAGRAAVRAACLAATLLALAASPARAVQEAELGRIRAAFPGGVGQRIAEVVEEARRDGLPTSPLVDKALEGVAKGVPPGEVLRAVTDHARQLREARRLVGAEVDEKGLVHAADALRRGVPGSAVRALARARPGELPMLLVVMGDLLREGVPAEAAQGLVEEAASREYRGDRLLSLPAAVRRLIRGGMGPAEAAESVRREVGGGQSLRPRRPGERADGRPPPGAGGPGARPAVVEVVRPVARTGS